MSNVAASNPHPLPHPPPYTASRARDREDWEEWESDDDPVTPIDAGEQVFIGGPPPVARSSVRNSMTIIGNRSSHRSSHRASRHNVKILRLKSRRRQAAQNAKAGITLITDMNSFRGQAKQGQHAKFVDAAALRALEGEPNSASVGNWNWFKRNKTESPASALPKPPAAQTAQTLPTPQTARSPDQGLSPEDRPIVIGFAMATEEAERHRTLSPTEEVTKPQSNPVRQQQRLEIPANSLPSQRNGSSDTPVHHVSVWSPDTPDTASTCISARYTSSVYSHMPSPIVGLLSPTPDVPPVPAVPPSFRRLANRETANNGPEDVDSPCTLFEEDGDRSPHRRALADRGPAATPDSAASKTNGWWDHVVTPFIDKKFSFVSRRQRIESPKTADREDEWWTRSGTETETRTRAEPEHEPKQGEGSQYLVPTLRTVPLQAPIVRTPTPRRTPSPQPVIVLEHESGPSTATSSVAPVESSPVNEKPPIVVVDEPHVEQPPPYSPRNRQENQDGTAPVRYRAVFPPGHPLNAQFPPSPGPVSPGLAGTMTSQGGTQMTDIPLTPGPRGNVPLPNRPLGTFVPQEHSFETSGRMTETERTRRRHEREDVYARKAGGFCRGRGCIPKKGCFGRTGPEGRKRRRICCLILCILLLLIILAIVLGVVLTRPHHHADAQSIWVNLTDFPPMPTGVMTVVGPDNSVAKTSCTEPSTLWSCYLPKDQHDEVSPYAANQPTIIMQIQWDNSSTNNWNTSDGDPPVARRSAWGAANAGSIIRERASLDFEPNPDAPTYKEEWFLGNTTDGVKSDEKGGEPAPFYISILSSLEGVSDDDLVKRDDSVSVNISDYLPSPSLNSDGTPKAAVLLPTPYQQPVRLYDRGLATEHYSFYSYFSRTLFVKSVKVLNDTDETNVPLDEKGGCSETEADYLTTWSQTRMLVQIWTKTLDANTSTLLSSDGQSAINGTEELIRPGTMPYPVTVTLDTHGGDRTKKFFWAWPMDDRQQLNESDPVLLSNNIGAGGTWINKRSTGKAKYGGYDGGTGGCKCQWVNWSQLTKS